MVLSATAITPVSATVAAEVADDGGGEGTAAAATSSSGDFGVDVSAEALEDAGGSGERFGATAAAATGKSKGDSPESAQSEAADPSESDGGVPESAPASVGVTAGGAGGESIVGDSDGGTSYFRNKPLDFMFADGTLEDLSRLRPHLDAIEDGMFDPLASDPSCGASIEGGEEDCDSDSPPKSTIETEKVMMIDATCAYGGEDQEEEEGRDVGSNGGQCKKETREVIRDKHWGSDLKTIKMRDKLRKTPSKEGRPPVFLMPGLAATRLVSWRYHRCDHSPLLSDIRVQDYVWLNMNFLLQMATIDERCWVGCLCLGPNQTDIEGGCKLRADEGLDAISSLAPGSVTSDFLIGGTNTVYAWLTQWLADNLGYDVPSVVGLPYDWRLSPDAMEGRDGFLTLTRRRIEAAVKTNGKPGIMVAHSVSFNYFGVGRAPSRRGVHVLRLVWIHLLYLRCLFFCVVAKDA